MKKTIYLVHYKADWHNADTEEKTYAFVSQEKAVNKANRLNKKVEKWNDDNGCEIVYAEGVGRSDFYENDYEDRFYISIEKVNLDCEAA